MRPPAKVQDYLKTGADDRLFDVLMATAIDGIIVMDESGFIEAFNASCERLFGYRLGEVVGRNLEMLISDPPEKPGKSRVIGESREARGRRKDGSLFPIALSVGEGRLGARKLFVAIIHDLTAMAAETAHRADADRLLAQIVQSSDDAILSETLDGIIMTWNAAAGRIFGYSAAEAIGQPVSILIPPDLLAEEARAMAHLRNGGEIQHSDTIRLRKDGGELQISLSVAPIRDGIGHTIGLSTIARDISEQKRAQAHAKTQANELAHMARLTAMGQMSAAIAHELNQPLTAVMNYVKAAQRLLEPEGLTPGQIETARGAMEKAARQTVRAGSIIRSLREFAEKRESRKMPENLNAVIHEALALAFFGASASNVKVTLDLTPHLPTVEMDKVQIQQVLVNLIRNSIEAMGDTLTRELAVSSERQGEECVIVTIRDTGTGLSPDVLSKLFHPFVTTKEKGMGIGLNICQAILEAHGGRIRALPDTRSGAAFEIRLPWVQADPADTQRDPAP